MLEVLTAEELAEWEAYNKMQPVGGWRQDFRIAMIGSTIVNIAKSIWGKKGEGKELTNPKDFIPQWDGTGNKGVKQESFDTMRTKMQAIAAMASPKKNKGKKKKKADERPKRKSKDQ